MNMFYLSVLVHITGLTLAAGTTFVGYLVNRRFWKFYVADRNKALTVMELGTRLTRIIGIGIGLLLVSGFYMVYLTKGIFTQQPWFRIKMILVLLVIVNSFVSRSLGKKMNALTVSENAVEHNSLKRKATLFYFIQLLLFFSIFVLKNKSNCMK